MKNATGVREWFSVRMRSAKNCIHEDGGEHLSGCERMVPGEGILAAVAAMLGRIENHPRGQADAINFRIDRVKSDRIIRLRALPIRDVKAQTIGEAREIAIGCLVANGVSPTAAEKALQSIRALEVSMRGAMILDARSGARLDETGNRGVRLSHMDCESEGAFLDFLRSQGFGGSKTREALILASKARAMEGYVGELCWSDDPGYVSGYVASAQCYCRITPMKSCDDPIGGRVIFVRGDTDLPLAIEFLERQPVLITV